MFDFAKLNAKKKKSDFRGSTILLYKLLVYYANAPQESFTDFSLFVSLMIKYIYSLVF